jgi:hypothetical protein
MLIVFVVEHVVHEIRRVGASLCQRCVGLGLAQGIAPVDARSRCCS